VSVVREYFSGKPRTIQEYSLSLFGSPNQKVKNCHYRQFSSEELKSKQLVYAAEMDEPQREMSSAEISDASDTKLTLDSG